MILVAAPPNDTMVRRTASVRTNARFLLSSYIVQELCESRGGRPELSVLTSLLVSVDVNNY